MTMAIGPFDIVLTPQSPSDIASGVGLGRNAFEKRFHGILDASSVGEMLSTAGSVPGSAGYVAIERVDGTLAGKPGTFALQHFGCMARGVKSLQIRVVPDSGTGALVGLSGTMNIVIADGKHGYEFDYVIEQKRA